MWNIAHALARIAIPVLFIVAGINQFMNINGLLSQLSANGLPAYAWCGYLIATVELVAGILVLVGFQTRWAALALFVYTGLTIFLIHHFWTMEGAAYAANQSQALKNLSIMAGLLMIAAMGPGMFSVDSRKI